MVGDFHVTGGKGTVIPEVANFFDGFPVKKWAIGLHYPPLRNGLNGRGWGLYKTMKNLTNEAEFLECALLPPVDPYSISSYSGIVYATRELVKDFAAYRKAYPGILFVDAAVYPYWIDKYKMSVLFNRDAELNAYKADFALFPKKYDPELADRIKEELSSELYVIKPRGEFLANGVIVVAQEDLDETLQLILGPRANLRKHPDKHYAYWARNRDQSFIVEKHYASDYLQFSTPISENAEAQALESGGYFHYDAAMRIAFIMKYDEGKITYHCLGGFWKLPCRALEEEGTLNEKRISLGEPPYYRSVDPKLFKEVNAKMERAMLLLYKEMLNL